MTSVARPSLKLPVERPYVPRVEYGTHPGVALRRWLVREQVSITEVARRLERSVPYVSLILNRHTLYGAETALRLEEVTGVSAEWWMTRKVEYQLAMAREARDE